MKVAVVIPARFASTRLPGKPLLRGTGKYLIEHVYERAVESGAATVVVATDDERIADAVRSFGGVVAMTRADHPSGTDRVAEVAAGLYADVVVNLQGDEPHLDPAAVQQLTDLLRDPAADVATLAAPIRDAATYYSPNAVKVVCDDRGRALLFSRSPVPCVREGEPDFAADPPRFRLHIGVYAFRRDSLLRLAALPPNWLEQTEKLEQLRWLAAGAMILVGTTPTAHRGIDTPADYAEFVASFTAGRPARG